MVTLYERLMIVEKEFAVAQDRIERFMQVRQEQLTGLKIRAYPRKNNQHTKEKIAEVDFSHKNKLRQENEYIKEVVLQAEEDRSRYINYQFHLFQDNPILQGALNEKQSVTESLEELATINSGAKRLLPRKKQPGHNKRVEQIRELIFVPHSLDTKGYAVPDNFVGAVAYTFSLITGFSYVVPYLMTLISKNPGPEVIETYKITGDVLGTFVAPTASLLIGAGLGLDRYERVDTTQAQTIDTYINELKE